VRFLQPRVPCYNRGSGSNPTKKTPSHSRAVGSSFKNCLIPFLEQEVEVELELELVLVLVLMLVLVLVLVVQVEVQVELQVELELVLVLVLKVELERITCLASLPPLWAERERSTIKQVLAIFFGGHEGGAPSRIFNNRQ